VSGLKSGVLLLISLYLTFFFMNPFANASGLMQKVVEYNQHFSDTMLSATGFIVWIISIVVFLFVLKSTGSFILAILVNVILLSFIGYSMGLITSKTEGILIGVFVINMSVFTLYFLPVGALKFGVNALMNLFTMHGALDVNTAYYIALLSFSLLTFLVVYLITEACLLIVGKKVRSEVGVKRGFKGFKLS